MSVALVYPNSYHIGMSSLGFQIAWRTIENHPQARAERFFMDTLGDGSIESGTPISEFDLVAISGTYEMDDPHVLDVIAAAGIPLDAARRGNQVLRRGTERHPLILMGGVLVAVNRMPLYPFIDVFVHGDAEAALPPILDALAADEIIASPVERLRAIENLPGVEITAGARIAAGLPLPDELRDAAAFDVQSTSPHSHSIHVAPPRKNVLEN
ncbi:hypothetical protein HY256_09035, partial [Candidatus Sumerlaeota bacterium]|nr:hypothetical protein [Candidatus Sumerlaeota bacterium]